MSLPAWRRHLERIVFGGRASTEQSRILFVVAWSAIGLVTTLLPIAGLVQPAIMERALVATAVVDIATLIAIGVAHAGRPRAASWLLVGSYITLVSALAVKAGGVRSPGVHSFLVFVLLATILLGNRAAILTAIACGSIVGALVVAESAGVLPAQTVTYGPLALALITCVYMGLIIVLSRLAAQTITRALHRAEAELAERRSAEQQLELALDAGSIGVWSQDLATGTFRGDDRAFALFGLPVTPDHRVPADTWQRLLNADDLPNVLGRLQDLADGVQHVRAAYRITRPDGAQRDIESAASSLLEADGKPAHVAGMVVDVTERKAIEREREQLVVDLGERVKELRLLHTAARKLQSDRPFDNHLLHDLVMELPSAWMYPECCEARITYGEFEASTPGWRPSAWMQTALLSTSAGAGRIDVAYMQERPPRTEGPFLEEERTLIDSLAEMLAAYIERDISSRQAKNFASQLRQSQKMEALGTLAGGIAHDFNNILTAVGGNVDLALADTLPDARSRVSLNEIAKATSRATDLVRRILLFSRKQESERKAIQVEHIAEEVLRLLRASLPPMIQIESEYMKGIPAVLADASQIHQVLMNLGTNAGHAMSAKGGTLSVAVRRVTIAESALRPSVDLDPGEYACVSVKDTGTGMSADILERLFEPFFTTKGHAGTGLGLSVVHGIVEDHGGVITVDSALGQGTIFRIYFPEATAPETAVAGMARDVVRGSGQHIMYVDDEEALVFLMARVLTRLGYRCTGFDDAEAALQAFRTDPTAFDAAITDMSMPGIDGLKLAESLVQIRPGFRVALASGYGAADADAACPSIVARLAKPVSRDQLGRVLHDLLE